MQDISKVKISEIFTSIQGEGIDVGKKHIFVRFCSCNLNCAYCDTDFSPKEELSAAELFQKLKNINCATLSLTGGEPLLEADFLKNFLEKYKSELNKKIYLETNGTLNKELEKIIDFIDIISMDIKLKSATGQENRAQNNEEFIKIALKKNKQIFIKIVFDNSILEEEIIFSTSLAKKYNIPLILQPKMPMDKELELEKIFEKFYSNYKNVRLIPQIHKFLHLA